MSTTPASSLQALPAGADAEAEYNSIEHALLESARGRWFLAEHGRRARRLDSARLDEALGKLQSSLRQPPALLGQLKAEISTLRSDMAAARARVLAKPAVPTDEPAPGEMLKTLEQMHQMAWTLQASPIDQAACEQIARQAVSIYARSVEQAAQSKRAKDVAASLEAALVKLDGILQTISLEANPMGKSPA